VFDIHPIYTYICHRNQNDNNIMLECMYQNTEAFGVFYKSPASKWNVERESIFDSYFGTHKQYIIETIKLYDKQRKTPDLNHMNKNNICWLLHGPKGTGKSSIIELVAIYLKLHIKIVNLTLVDTYGELVSILNSHSNTIIVFDEFDVAIEHMKRNELNKVIDKDGTTSFKKSITIQDLQSLIQGVGSTPNRIIIATTNHYDKIKVGNEPLFRAGRLYPILIENLMPDQLNEVSLYYFNREFNYTNGAIHLCTSDIITHAHMFSRSSADLDTGHKRFVEYFNSNNKI
jgi:hypothetical protein